jgi:hypothetical protein
MSTVVSKRITKLSGTSAVLGASTEVVLTLSSQQVKVIIQRIKIKHQSGAAASFTPRIVSLTGAAATAIECEYAGANTAVATLFDVTNIGGYCYTDSAGKLYLTPTPNAGADNIFKYAVYFEIVE